MMAREHHGFTIEVLEDVKGYYYMICDGSVVVEQSRPDFDDVDSATESAMDFIDDEVA